MSRSMVRPASLAAGLLAGLVLRPDAGLAQAAASPEATVQAFMRFADAGGEKALVNYGAATAPMRKLFTTRLVADWEKAMSYNDLEPVFDADIFDGQQGMADIKLVRLWTETDAGETALVGATLSGVGDDKAVKTHDQVFVLLRQGGAWKIDEIVYRSRQDPPDALHAGLRRTIAEHAPPARPKR